jgi:threonine/homoserine/homoserine lactone efflux protein
MAVGISIAAPVGPIALLCLRRTLTDGRLVGFVSGLGAATADTLCGMVAAFALSALLAAVQRYHTLLEAGGGIFMLALGLHVLRSAPAKADLSPAHARNLRAAYGSTLLLTLANPMTLLSFAGVAAALGRDVIGATPWTATQFVLGVFTGSAAWWFLWCGAAGWFRQHLGPDTLRWVNRVAGGAIAIFGAAQLVRLAW